MRVVPGPIPKDGKVFDDTDRQLSAFVDQTVIDQLTPSNFDGVVQVAVYSATEPPAVAADSMLWFNQAEGRLYTRFTGGESAASAAKNLELVSEHWVCMSDRKEVYAHMHVPESLSYIGKMALELTLQQYNADTLNPEKANGTDYGSHVRGTGPSPYYGIVAGYLGSGSGFFSDKVFLPVTAESLAGPVRWAGRVHELGYRRTQVTGSGRGLGSNVASGVDVQENGVPSTSGGSVGSNYCYIAQDGPGSGEIAERLVYLYSLRRKSQSEDYSA